MHERHLVLHGLAIKKYASKTMLAAVTGLTFDTVKILLEQALTSGRAASAGNKYMLTPLGRMIIEAQYSHYYDNERQNKKFTSANERFEIINKAEITSQSEYLCLGNLKQAQVTQKLNTCASGG